MVDKSNEYGYVPSSPTQARGSNTGIFEVNDVTDLLNAQQWSGDFGTLELIETQTVSSSSTADFTTLGSYNVHLFTFNDIQFTNTDTMRARVSNDSGSTFESTSNYDSAIQENKVDGTANEITRLNYDAFDRIFQSQSSVSYNGYMYAYNLLDSSKYSFLTHQQNCVGGGIFSFRFGSQVYKVAEANDAIRFYVVNNMSGTISLYGIAES